MGKICFLTFIIAVAFSYFNIDNFSPFFLETRVIEGVTYTGGFAGTIKGASLTYFAYVGFDLISTLAEDSKNPKRDMPRSIYISINICIIFYILTSVSIYGVAKLDE